MPESFPPDMPPDPCRPPLRERLHYAAAAGAVVMTAMLLGIPTPSEEIDARHAAVATHDYQYEADEIPRSAAQAGADECIGLPTIYGRLSTEATAKGEVPTEVYEVRDNNCMTTVKSDGPGHQPIGVISPGAVIQTIGCVTVDNKMSITFRQPDRRRPQSGQVRVDGLTFQGDVAQPKPCGT